MIVNALLGTKFKPLLGYVDAAGVGLAMERGELEGYCSFTWGSIKSARPKWIEQKLINILLQLTTEQASGASACSAGDGSTPRTRPRGRPSRSCSPIRRWDVRWSRRPTFRPSASRRSGAPSTTR